MNIST